MKVLEEIKVSVYENVYSKKPRVMSFLEVIIMCIHPIYASIINAIRRYYAEGDHAAAQKLKNQLPCFTPAGTFDCTKVKFKIKSRSPKETIEGYGYEWYAPVSYTHLRAHET